MLLNSLKIIPNCYPVNFKLAKFNNSFSPKCSFCYHVQETIDHLFWNCVYCKLFWIFCLKKIYYPQTAVLNKIFIYLFGDSLKLLFPFKF